MSSAPKVIIKRSSAGLGLFAAAAFTKNELILEYTGEVISEATANERGGKYLFELNDHWTIDGSSRKNLARYINHSCRPNCYPELNETETKVFIYAKKNIAPGTELTYHYGRNYFNQLIKPAGCKCAKCQAAN